MHGPFIDWPGLRNPVYAREGWAVKDGCMAYCAGTFYLFFSAFFLDRDRERSHVVCINTADWHTFSEPLFVWDGREEGWLGMASPNITELDGAYLLTYNSWGDQRGRPNQLFYATSSDLERWDAGHPLAADLTAGRRVIDAAVAFHNGFYLLAYKEHQVPRMAWARSLGPEGWTGIGRARGGWFENAELIQVDGTWHLLVTGIGFLPYLARLRGCADRPESWTQWVGFRRLRIPRERFNRQHRANAAFLVDWRAHDGFFYLLYTGTTEGRSHARRGDCRLALARSRDLVRWQVPGAE